MGGDQNFINGSRMKVCPLIVSYSYTGNTQRIARELKALTGGDWYEIYPWQPYPASFPELLKQVKREIRSGYHPRLLPVPGTPHRYPVVFVGSPNWCGTIAPPLSSWLYRNDLSGKIILPFYSHCGGAEGDLRRDIASLCPGADVREALGVCTDDRGSLAELLHAWLERTGVQAIFGKSAGAVMAWYEDIQNRTGQ